VDDMNEIDALPGPQMTDERAVRAGLAAHWARLVSAYGDYSLAGPDFEALALDTIRRRLAKSGERAGLPILETLALDDLYLAQGCAARSPAAWRRFETQYGPMLDRLSLLFSTSVIGAGDARQELLVSLFSGRRGQGSAFQSYRGIASLNGWLRVALRRVVIDLYRSVRWRPLPGGAGAIELGLLPDPTPGVEPLLISSRTAQSLVAILDEVVTALPAVDRRTLLMAHRDGCRLEDIGLELGVHLTTAQRRLERIREDVGRAVLRLARARLALSPEDVYAVRDMMADFFGFSDPSGAEPGT
jgi:DNA-directed RNA polymerase specialized sigma24 family protein